MPAGADSRHIRVLALGAPVLGLLLVGCGTNVATPSPTAPPARTVPATPSTSPTPAGPFWIVESSAGDPPELVAAIRALPGKPSTGTAFVVDSVTVVQDWAIGWAGVEPYPSALASPTETAVVLGHLVGGGWVVITDRDPDFCTVLAEAPQIIADNGERAYFAGCH